MPDPVPYGWPRRAKRRGYHASDWWTAPTSATTSILYGLSEGEIAINATTWGDNYYAWGRTTDTGGLWHVAVPTYVMNGTGPVTMPPPYRESDEQRALRIHVAACRKLDRGPEGERAWHLLREFLGDRDRREIEARRERGELTNGGFYVDGSAGGRYYIERGYPNGNVRRLGGDCSCGSDCEFPCHQRIGIAPPCDSCGCALERERFVARYCLHPPEPVPTDDTCLAQMLFLQHDERGFERAANIS